MPEVHAIIETALHVRDLNLAAECYRQLFGFKTLFDSDRLIALDVAGRTVLLLFPEGRTNEPFVTPGGVIPPHGSSGSDHLAFSITADEFDSWTKRLAEGEIAIESVVSWPGGARSIYFRDPDHHLVELLTPGFWAIY